MGLAAMAVEVLAGRHAEDGDHAHFKENGYRQKKRNGDHHSAKGRCSTAIVWDAHSSFLPMPIPVPVALESFAVVRMGCWNDR